MAKDDGAPADAGHAEDEEDGKDKSSKAKKDRRPGPRTVARPALFGAALLTLAAAALPRP